VSNNKRILPQNNFHQKPYNSQLLNILKMETITIPKQEFKEMKAELEELRTEKDESLPSVEKQLEKGLEELRQGKIVHLN